MRKQKPEILWHYCSFDTFKKIIEGNSIRLSSLSKSNDPTELQLYKNYKNELINLLSSDSGDELLTLNEYDFRSIFSDGYDTKGICLSEKGDFLPLWYMYGDKAEGISIGLDSSWLESVFSGSERDCVFPSFSYVRYNDAERKLLIEELKKIDGNNKINQRKAEMLLFKDDGYEYEAEWRASIRPEKTFYSNLKRMNKGNFESLAKLMEIIYPIYFSPQFSNNPDAFLNVENSEETKAILKIRIGPCFKGSIYELKRFLDANGYGSVEIERSKIPFINTKSK